VLEGSVQRGGNRMRVNVQLIDADSGHHLWAERFDKPLADLFDMQDEIVARLANALDPHLVAAEARRAEQSPTPDSMDLYFQRLAWLNKSMTPGNVAQARSFFDRALSADPDNTEALVVSARTDILAGALFFAKDPAAAFVAAEEKLTKVFSTVPDHPRGHSALGFVRVYGKRAAQGIASCEHALRLDHNLAQAHATIGWCKIFIGLAEETEGHVAEALRLSPRDNLAYVWVNYVGVAKSILGFYELAARWHRRSIEANPNFPPAYLWLAAALGQLGQLDEARSVTQAALALNLTFTVARARSLWTAMGDDPTYLEGLEPVFEGLHQGGDARSMTTGPASPLFTPGPASRTSSLVAPRKRDMTSTEREAGLAEVLSRLFAKNCLPPEAELCPICTQSSAESRACEGSPARRMRRSRA
jgi:tetratricopeptide (TPR) repeat protein